MKLGVKTRSVLQGLAVVLLFAFSVASASAIVGDWALRDVLPKGAVLAGHDLHGMNGSQVRATIEEVVSTPMMRPLTARGDGKSFTLDPKGIVDVDVESMVDSAYEPAREASLITRVVSRVAARPLPVDVEPVYSVDASSVAGWVAGTAAAVAREPVDASRTVDGYAIRVNPAVLGAKLDQPKAVEVLSRALTDNTALTSSGRIASLPIDPVEPKVTESNFKMAIVVSLSQCRVYLYEGQNLVTTYPCAPGQRAWPTPKGDFKIDKKLANAPWINPGSSWAASMPKVIKGGPGNPMGDRKIGINYPGVFLHGIPRSEYSSIGTHASHGCMRMMPAAIHDLYPRVSIGDPVYIRD